MSQSLPKNPILVWLPRIVVVLIVCAVIFTIIYFVTKKSDHTTPSISTPTFIPTYQPTISPTHPQTYQPTISPTHPPTYPPTYPSTVSPTYPSTVSPTYPPTVSPTYPPTVSPTVSPTLPRTYPPTLPPTLPPKPFPTVYFPPNSLSYNSNWTGTWEGWQFIGNVPTRVILTLTYPNPIYSHTLAFTQKDGMTGTLTMGSNTFPIRYQPQTGSIEINNQSGWSTSLFGFVIEADNSLSFWFNTSGSRTSLVPISLVVTTPAPTSPPTTVPPVPTLSTTTINALLGKEGSYSIDPSTLPLNNNINFLMNNTWNYWTHPYVLNMYVLSGTNVAVGWLEGMINGHGTFTVSTVSNGQQTYNITALNDWALLLWYKLSNDSIHFITVKNF